MKFSETWLREWVNPKLDRAGLSDLLTNSGLEVESITPAAEVFSGVVVGQINQVQKHPKADDLFICEVDVAETSPLTIVCGAKNVKKNMKVAVAKVNAVLPDNTIITNTTIHDMPSQGMLLSSKELALTDEDEVIIELPPDASIGQDLWKYFNLEDYIFDLSITPNRGDCLSVKGIAREVSALTQTPLQEIITPEIKAQIKDQLNVTINASKECPHYIGRVISEVKTDALTPAWIKERLRRSGIRSINAVVDIVNYVMLELGQPMHAFDYDKLSSEIIVRLAKQGEKLLLLDGSEKTLTAETLIIADRDKPLAIAGVMGGMDSSVTLLTKSIFLESAYFEPETVARSRQHYQIISDSAFRYERGVDPALQKQAIERASQLILEICGGRAGPLTKTITPYYPQPEKVHISKDNITRLLGINIPDNEIQLIFQRLAFNYRQLDAGAWEVNVPSFRFDIKIPEDLIEEVARLYGYNKIPTGLALKGDLKPLIHTQYAEANLVRTSLCDIGYHEVITYSFISQALQKLFDPQTEAKELVNPISNDMTTMRTSLWPGLINTMLYNMDRQQPRVRIFEIGKTFTQKNEKFTLAGLISGLNLPEQWGIPSRNSDFYDIKGHVEMLFNRFKVSISFQKGQHPALHPGQSAAIYLQDKPIGFLGSLHPFIARELDIRHKVYLFELDLDSLNKNVSILAKDISKFPEIRRDIAIIVNEAVPAENVQDTIKQVAGDWLNEVFIFDVYQGKGISSGYKSIALALILQHPMRTLTDSEISDLMERVILALKEQFAAELRS